MRRTIAIGITFIFLIQIFTVTMSSGRENIDGVVFPSRRDHVPERAHFGKLRTDENPDMTTHAISRSATRADSWEDDFDDESGIGWMDNISFREGGVGMMFNNVSPDENLVGLWHLDDEGSDTARDSSGNENHGAIHGGIWTDGIMGGGLDFIEPAEYVDCGSGADFNITEGFTLEAWVKPDLNLWKFKRTISIERTKVAGNLTDFPVLVSIIDPDIRDAWNGGVIQPDGDDILFTSMKGALLDFEIESYDGAEGKLIAWVKLENLSNVVDNEFLLHYGNPGAEELQNGIGVWDDDYLMVHHLAERLTTVGDGNDHEDSTHYDMDGEAQNGLIMNGIGKIDGADDFDGQNDYIDCGMFRPPPEGTISFWINVDALGGSKDRIMGGDDAFEIKLRPLGNGYRLTNDLWISGSGILQTDEEISFNTWYHVACTYHSGGLKEIYVNGTMKKSANKAHNDPGTDRFTMGVRYGTSDYFDGRLDEIRISGIPRTTNWINTSFENQARPSGFIEVGDQMPSDFIYNPANWTFKRPITLSPSTSTDDYQVKVELKKGDFDYNRTGTGGDDLRFFDDNRTPLNYWIEHWNEKGTSTVWVKVKDSGTSRINMYYGNNKAEPVSNGSATFDHFDDFPEDHGRFYNTEYAGLTVQGGSWIIDNGILKNYWGPDHVTIDSTADSVPGLAIRANVMENAYWKYPQLITGWQDIDNYYVLTLNGGNNRIELTKKVGGVSTKLLEAQTTDITINRWYSCELIWTSNQQLVGKIWDSGGNPLVSLSTSLDEGWTSGDCGLSGPSGVSRTWFDEIVVRKFNGPEPVATMGEEAGGEIGKIGSFGIGRYGTTAYGSINNQTINGILKKGWNHIAATYDGEYQSLYIDGKLSASMEYNHSISVTESNFLMGDLLGGTMDEVRLYNRSMNMTEIRDHANLYRRNGTLVSSVVSMEGGRVWNRLQYGCSLPDNTSVNVTLYDAETDEILIRSKGNDSLNTIDISWLDPLEIRKLYLVGEFISARMETPVLNNWSLSWGPPDAPRLVREMETILLTEDISNNSVMDLALFFLDAYAEFSPSTYSLEHVSEDESVILYVNGSMIGMSVVAENWTGNISVTASCTNLFGLKTVTPPFEMIVLNVNDPPIVKLFSPLAGTTHSDKNVTLHWKGFDVDNRKDELTYDLYLGDSYPPSLYRSDLTKENITLHDLEDMTGYYWFVLPSDGELTGWCTSGVWNFSIDTRIMVPDATLLSPLNGVTVDPVDVTLMWQTPYHTDVIYDIHLGKSIDALYKVASTANETYSLKDLDDNATYYWKIIPVIGQLYGRCASGTWKFHTNLSFYPVHSVRLYADVEVLEIALNETVSFNLSVINEGNLVETIILAATGPLASYVAMVRTINAERGTNNITVTLSIPLEFEPGFYNLSISARYMTKKEEINIPVMVKGSSEKENDGGINDDDGDDDGFLFESCGMRSLILVGLAIFVIVQTIVITIFIRNRRKSGRRNGSETVAVKEDALTTVPSSSMIIRGDPGGIVPVDSVNVQGSYRVSGATNRKGTSSVHAPQKKGYLLTSPVRETRSVLPSGIKQGQQETKALPPGPKEAGRTEMGPDGEERSCPKCSGRVTGMGTICENCGEPLKGDAQPGLEWASEPEIYDVTPEELARMIEEVAGSKNRGKGDEKMEEESVVHPDERERTEGVSMKGRGYGEGTGKKGEKAKVEKLVDDLLKEFEDEF